MDLKEKFLTKQELTSYEVEKVIHYEGAEGITYIEEIKGENESWTRTNLVIFEVNRRYFQLEYIQGLTECQEYGYWPQIPVEVKKVEKTIVVTDWEEIKE